MKRELETMKALLQNKEQLINTLQIEKEKYGELKEKVKELAKTC